MSSLAYTKAVSQRNVKLLQYFGIETLIDGQVLEDHV